MGHRDRRMNDEIMSQRTKEGGGATCTRQISIGDDIARSATFKTNTGRSRNPKLIVKFGGMPTATQAGIIRYQNRGRITDSHEFCRNFILLKFKRMIHDLIDHNPLVKVKAVGRTRCRHIRIKPAACVLWRAAAQPAGHMTRIDQCGLRCC